MTLKKEKSLNQISKRRSIRSYLFVALCLAVRTCCSRCRSWKEGPGVSVLQSRFVSSDKRNVVRIMSEEKPTVGKASPANAIKVSHAVHPAHFDDDEGAARERDAIDYTVKITRSVTRLHHFGQTVRGSEGETPIGELKRNNLPFLHPDTWAKLAQHPERFASIQTEFMTSSTRDTPDN